MRLSVIGLVLVLAAPLIAKGETMPLSPEKAAIAVADRYAVTFGNLFLKSPLDGTVLAFPTLTPADFRLVEETADTWTFAYEPLAGPAIRARVAKANGFVEFDQVVLSTE